MRMDANSNSLPEGHNGTQENSSLDVTASKKHSTDDVQLQHSQPGLVEVHVAEQNNQKPHKVPSVDSKESMISDQDMLLASTLIKDAIAGRNMAFKTDAIMIRRYLLHNHIVFKVLLYVAIWGNLSLAIFENPALVPGIPYWGTMVMEAFFLSFFMFRLVQNFRFSPKMTFVRDAKNIANFALIIVTVLDIICYCLWVNVAPSASAAYAVRWSRPLRPLFMVNYPEGRQVRKAFRNIRRTLPDIAHVLVLFLFSIALFALMGLKLFQKRGLVYPDGKAYFDTYFEAFWDLYILVTTANNPDVMMPAYDQSRWWCLFFLVFLVINLYIFMSIVLAVVYNNYKHHLKNEVKATVYMKRRLLARAFNLLRHKIDGKFRIVKETWHTLLHILDPQKSKVHVELLLYVLDDRGDGTVDKSSFLKLADLLNVGVAEVTDKTLLLERLVPRFFHSRPSQFVKLVVRHRGFRFFFDFAILVNAFCIGFNLDEAEWFFLAIFMLEIILKLYTFGPIKFFKNIWNTFDFVVVVAALVVTIIETILKATDVRERTLDFILVLRCLRLVRLMGAIERFQIVITTIVNIGPSIMTYGGVIFVVYYVFAILGMEIFHGRIQYYGYEGLNASTLYCGNPSLNGSEFYLKRYCNNNFNNIASAFVLLFELMVVNQWHVLAHGHVAVTHVASRLYFISFHMVCVVILLNIFTAFVLEVFMLEYNVSKGELETAIETKIKEMGLGEGQQINHAMIKKQDTVNLVDNIELDESKPETGESSAVPPPTDTTDSHRHEPSTEDIKSILSSDSGLRFKLKTNTNKSIGVILQNMFEGEIDPTDEGPDDDGQVSEGSRHRRLTLSNVDAVP